MFKVLSLCSSLELLDTSRFKKNIENLTIKFINDII